MTDDLAWLFPEDGYELRRPDDPWSRGHGKHVYVTWMNAAAAAQPDLLALRPLAIIDDDGIPCLPLYVGQTTNLSTRMSGHRHHSSWWPLVWAVMIMRCSSRDEMAEREDLWIKAYDPPFNVKLRPRFTSPAP